VASAFYVDKKSTIQGPNGLEYHLKDAASKETKQLLMIGIYNLPNRDCSAFASAGEICCTYNPDGTCNFLGGGNCAAGIVEYQTTYIDPLYELLAQYQSLVEIVLLIEGDSLANLASNAGNPRCGSAATTAAYSAGIYYAVDRFKDLSVTMYLDAAHGAWMGWGDNLSKLTSVIVNVMKGNIVHLRGFATNVANWQPVGIMCPFQSNDGVRNLYCTNGQNRANDPCCADPCNSIPNGNVANNELNYINMLLHSISAAVPGYKPHFVVDTSRNGVPNSRSDCGNFCNVRNARIGLLPTAVTAKPDLIDAYIWMKTPGESDGCTQLLPDGNVCNRFDAKCASVDSIGTRAGEPRAPQAGSWFDYQIKLLVSDPA